MKKSEAIRRLKTLVAWTDEPTLSEDDVELLVDGCRVRDAAGYPREDTHLWEAGTVYEVGDVIVPTERDGHSYIATTAGTTAASEPTWATSVTDGTVVWERHESSYWTPTYDLNYAAYQGW